MPTIKQTDEEFYIGWMARAPQQFARHTRKVILLLGMLVCVGALLLALMQRPFGKGSFEFGKLTTVTGVYGAYPIPHLRVKSRPDLLGRVSLITIPLVGYGKHGAAGVMEDLAEDHRSSLDNQIIQLRGTLLYNDGKTLMQIDGNDQPLLSVNEAADTRSFAGAVVDLGTHEMKGEIVDPKCYFGVMKPGEGKPHKDCAIRCILGGIPPVLRVTDREGRSNYYLVMGPEGEPVNEAVAGFVAEPVSLTAKMYQYDDWVVLFTNTRSLERTSYLSMTGREVASCGTGCNDKKAE